VLKLVLNGTLTSTAFSMDIKDCLTTGNGDLYRRCKMEVSTFLAL